MHKKDNYFEAYKKRRGEFMTFLLEDGRLSNIGYTLIVFAVTIVIFFLYGFKWIDSLIAFFCASILIGVRMVVLIIEKVKNPKYWENRPDKTEKQILFAIQNCFMIWVFLMLYNLIFYAQFWYIIGVTNSWIGDISISINSILCGLIIMGFYMVYIEKDYFLKNLTQRTKGKFSEYEAKKREKRGTKLEKAGVGSLIWMYVLLMIIIPLVLMVTLIPIFQQIDAQTYGGVLSNTRYKGSKTQRSVYEGQAIDDWFGYVFYILFQAPVPALMIAFMGVSAIAVILAQNLASIGRLVSGVAVGIIAIIPMLFVISAISGSIPPPQELMDVIGLSRPIASFIYGLGLILTYIVMVSLMATFIASSRALAGDFA